VPVECGGVTIKSATLHNFDEVKRLGVREGDRVLIERAGDVIPKIVKVVGHGNGKALEIPRTCPVCNGKVIKEKEEGVAYRCINPSCPAQIERGILHFASRAAMDIAGMGESVVKQLVSRHMVKSIADVFGLTPEDISKLELFKEKKTQNLFSAIERSKQAPLRRLIYGLGIRHVGEKTAEILAEKFGNLEALAKARKQDLENIPEIGPVIAQSIVDFFSQPQAKEIIRDLKKYGVNMSETRAAKRANAFTNKKVVFTGELSGLTRAAAEEQVRLSGGYVSSGVSKKQIMLS